MWYSCSWSPRVRSPVRLRLLHAERVGHGIPYDSRQVACAGVDLALVRSAISAGQQSLHQVSRRAGVPSFGVRLGERVRGVLKESPDHDLGRGGPARDGVDQITLEPGAARAPRGQVQG